MSSRYDCDPPPAPRSSNDSGRTRPPEPPSANAPKSASSMIWASSISRTVSKFTFSVASNASFCNSNSSGREPSS
eukprot:15435788-Alexandrium_andersonii.AAC.1